MGASMQRDGSASSWMLWPLFELDPMIGFCAQDAWVSCKLWARGRRRDRKKYDDVRAIQLGVGGRTLSVLVGSGALHMWDLQEGKLLGIWRSHAAYTTMCHTGNHLFMSRQGRPGPVLSRFALPPELAQSHHQ